MKLVSLISLIVIVINLLFVSNTNCDFFSSLINPSEILKNPASFFSNKKEISKDVFKDPSEFLKDPIKFIKVQRKFFYITLFKAEFQNEFLSFFKSRIPARYSRAQPN
jgi:hypothetical protein